MRIPDKRYTITDNCTEVLKWVREYDRQENTQRGVDWDFSGGFENVEIYFNNERLELAYIMRYEFAK